MKKSILLIGIIFILFVLDLQFNNGKIFMPTLKNISGISNNSGQFSENRFWMKELDSDTAEQITSIALSSNGYMIAGETGDASIFVMEVSEEGKRLWYEVFPNNIKNGGNPVAIEIDDGYMVSYHYPPNKSMINTPEVLIGTTLILDKETKKIINKNDVPFQFIIPIEKGIIASGNNNYIYRLDEKGKVIWKKQIKMGQPNYGTFYGKKYEFSQGVIRDIKTTKDGGFIGLGSMKLEKPKKHSSPWLFKFDVDGNILWIKSYDDIYLYPDSLMETEDGGFIINGRKTIKIDMLGNIQWVKEYGSRSGYGIAKTNGGFLLANLQENWTLQFIYIDSNGNVLRRQNYNINETTFIHNLLQTSNAIVIGGYLQNKNEGTNIHGWLMKTDYNGENFVKQRETLYPD